MIKIKKEKIKIRNKKIIKNKTKIKRIKRIKIKNIK